MRIVILEDNEERRDAMQACISDRFPFAKVEFFVAANPMIKHLEKTRMFDVALIALDNDLEMIQSEDGSLIDPGDGVQVAKWLATQPVTTPIIVHTTNMPAGREITQCLRDAGYIAERVVPYGDTDWINEPWHRALRTLIVENEPDKTIGSLSLAIVSTLTQCFPEYPLETALFDIALCGQHIVSSLDNQISVELFTLVKDERIMLAHTGNGPLSQIGIGPIREMLYELIEPKMLGIGDEFVDFMPPSIPIKQCWIDRLRISADMEAAIVVSSFADGFDLDSHTTRSVLSHLKMAAEICIRTAVILGEPPQSFLPEERLTPTK